MTDELRNIKEIQRDLAGLANSPQHSLISDEYAHRLAADVASLLGRLEAVRAECHRIDRVAWRHGRDTSTGRTMIKTVALVRAALQGDLVCRVCGGSGSLPSLDGGLGKCSSCDGTGQR